MTEFLNAFGGKKPLKSWSYEKIELAQASRFTASQARLVEKAPNWCRSLVECDLEFNCEHKSTDTRSEFNCDDNYGKQDGIIQRPNRIYAT